MKVTVLNGRLFLVAFASALLAAPIYYAISAFFDASPNIFRIYFFTTIAAGSILAGYEIFFLIQARSNSRIARILQTRLDRQIPFIPQFVWIYGFAYYFILLIPLSFFHTYLTCTMFILGGLLVYSISAPIFLIFPTMCPPQWRQYAVENVSTRFLYLIQNYDSGRCCFPSMHCSLAAYSAIFLPTWWASLIAPFVVALSCLFVKQHSVLEIPFSLIFGFVVGAVVKSSFT